MLHSVNNFFYYVYNIKYDLIRIFLFLYGILDGAGRIDNPNSFRTRQ